MKLILSLFAFLWSSLSWAESHSPGHHPVVPWGSVRAPVPQSVTHSGALSLGHSAVSPRPATAATWPQVAPYVVGVPPALTLSHSYSVTANYRYGRNEKWAAAPYSVSPASPWKFSWAPYGNSFRSYSSSNSTFSHHPHPLDRRWWNYWRHYHGPETANNNDEQWPAPPPFHFYKFSNSSNAIVLQGGGSSGSGPTPHRPAQPLPPSLTLTREANPAKADFGGPMPALIPAVVAQPVVVKRYVPTLAPFMSEVRPFKAQSVHRHPLARHELAEEKVVKPPLFESFKLSKFRPTEEGDNLRLAEALAAIDADLETWLPKYQDQFLVAREMLRADLEKARRKLGINAPLALKNIQLEGFEVREPWVTLRGRLAESPGAFQFEAAFNLENLAESLSTISSPLG